MKIKIVSDIYINGNRIVYKIINSRISVSYELENSELLNGDLKGLSKTIKCGCNKITDIKNHNPWVEKKFICKSCRTKGERNPMYGKSTLDVWVEKYGKEEADMKWAEKSQKYKGEGNAFYGKKHTDDQKKIWSDSMKGKYSGESNPMYGKSVYDIWVEKYGKKEAEELKSELNKKISVKNSGESNPMYGKSVYDIWVEKYGSEKANERMLELSKLLNDNILKIRGTDKWYNILNKISISLKGRFFSDEHRKNLRISTLNNIKKNFPNGKPFTPNFSTKACEYFDSISEEQNIEIQHALNGGEFYIKKLGYFVDGYDNKSNTVYEFDEPYHFDNEGNLKERDIKRQKEIEDFLKCKFIRIKSWKDHLS